jgi:hypothetical protein
MLATGQALARGLHADQAHALVRDVGVEDAHRVAATTHAGDDGIGLPPGRAAELGDLLGHLLQTLLADDALEVAHHRRVGVRAGHGADDVEGVLDVRDPVAQRLVQRVLERLAAAVHRHHVAPSSFMR